MEHSHNRSLTATYIFILIAGLMIFAKYWQNKSAVVPKYVDNAIKSISEPLGIADTFFEKTDNKDKAEEPKIESVVAEYSGPRAYIVGNILTGKIFLKKNESKVLPVASMSKLITAIAATDSMSGDKVIEVTEPETKVAPDASNLFSGERFTVDQLLYPLLLNSSNVAAEALASSTNRAKFLELMSSYAWEVGMPSTFFADPSGLSPTNQSTANDFFALARYLYKSRPDILRITQIPSASAATTSDHGSHSFTNIHPFIGDSNFIGGKTGRTPEAGETMLTILNINNQPIAFIILGSAVGKREADTRELVSKFKAL